MISHETVSRREFPSDQQASWFAKHLHLNISGCFGNMEASVDDMMFVLFNALGFNDGDLVTVYVLHFFFFFDLSIDFAFRSRNKLPFQMSKSTVNADADLTVFNIKSWIRLAVVEVGFF